MSTFTQSSSGRSVPAVARRLLFLLLIQLLDAGMVAAEGQKRVVIEVQPPTAASSGSLFEQPPVLVVKDAAGKPLRDVEILAEAGPGVEVSSARSVTDPEGRATFNGLRLTGKAGRYTLRFVVDSLAIHASHATKLLAGPPAALTLIAEPSAGAANGTPMAREPVVEVRDSSGNPVEGVMVNVATKSGVAVAPASVVTGSDGRALFGGLRLTGKTGEYLLRFDAGALSVSAPLPVRLLAGSPASLRFRREPAGEEVGEPLKQQPELRVEDASGNPVPGVVVKAEMAPGYHGKLLQANSSPTDHNGTALFSSLTFQSTFLTAAPSYRLSFTAGMHTVQSGDITFRLKQGEQYQGGIIAYLGPPYPNGLIAAEQATECLVECGGNGTNVEGTVVRLAGGGENTCRIIAALGGSVATAAGYCDALSSNGHDDWYLPSKAELNLLYHNLKLKGIGNFSEMEYWSSSHYSKDHGWYQYFANGVQFVVPKSRTFRVRAVRSF